MKILYITNGFPPDRWAGTETYTASLARNMIDHGVEVQVLCCGEWDAGSAYWNGTVDDTYNDIPVRKVTVNWTKAPDPFGYLYKNPVVGNYLAQYLDEIRPDLVHVTSCETLSASVLEVVKAKRIPLALSITDFWFLCPRINLLRSNGENCNGITTPWDCLKCQLKGSKIYRWSNSFIPKTSQDFFWTEISKHSALTRQRGLRGYVGDMSKRKQYLRHAFSYPNLRLTASEFVRNIHYEAGFTDDVQLHPYGHELTWLESYSGKMTTPQIKIGFIGQIIHSKGIHILLEAIKHLDNSIREKIKILIYGNLQKNPIYGTHLQLLANDVGNVSFYGTYPRAKSADIYSRMDVLVVPSLWYDFPLVIHEAFATGTPVIATKLGGMAEAVSHGVDGLLFERGNPVDLAQQIKRLVEEPNLLNSLSDGISNVKTVEQEGCELRSIYKDLVTHKNEETLS